MTERLPSLPQTLHEALERLGAKIDVGRPVEAEVASVVEQFGALSPSDVTRIERDVALAGGLWHRQRRRRFFPQLLGWCSEAEQLKRVPALGYVFLFHRDGYLREAALKQIDGAIPSAFLVAAISWRLNDWVQPVRQAAAQCAERCFGVTDPAIVAEALAALMVRQASWGRWQDERVHFERPLERADVGQQMVGLFATRTTGPMARLLRACMATPHLDEHLEEIFRTAVQPSVRAAALDIIVKGEVASPTGRHEYQWIDKSSGLRRRAMIFERRAIKVARPVNELIRTGIGDRSALVRSVALSAAIRVLRGTATEQGYARQLQDDRSRAVRDRVKFILENPVA